MENTPDGRMRRSLTFEGTYSEADLALTRMRLELAEDRPVPTIGDAYRIWYKPWLERRIADGKTKARTGEIYTACWDRHIKQRWGKTPIDSVPPAVAQQWFLGLSASNAKMAHVVLRRICDFAVQFEVLEANKFRLPYEMPTGKGGGKRPDTYTLAQTDKMLAKLRGTMSEAPFILACFGGARTGESLGVRSSEVKRMQALGFTFAVFPIVRRMDNQGDLPLPDGDLKTEASLRTGIVPDPYATRLLEIAERQVQEGVEWLADRGDGLPLSRSALYYAWKRDAGEDIIPFANLRNSWRTFAQYDWCIDYDTLEVLMGHKLTGTTGEHYLKPTVDNLVNAVARALVQFANT
ncbi:MAG: hypothetical protein RR178_09445 [Gordonibacter sp.]